MNRRTMIRAMAGAGLLLVGCRNNVNNNADTNNDAAAECETIPPETPGPFPGDGSNGPDVLTQDGIVRRDITSSFGGMSGTAGGVPLAIRLTIMDDAACAPLAGAAVYIWQCDREGRYSLYSPGAINQNYLRGVQEAGADGVVEFASIFPAAYPGRWPHIHFDVYPTLDAATSAKGKVATSQLALPQDACEAVYATEGYEQSVRAMGSLSLRGDNVFRNGADQQLAVVTGSVVTGYVATLPVPV